MDDASIAQCEIWFSRQFAENCDYRLLKKTSEARPANYKDESGNLKADSVISLQRVGHRNEAYESFQQPATEARYSCLST